MQESNALIAMYDETGCVVGKKQRCDVDKKKDILKSVSILLVNGEGKILVSRACDTLYPDMVGSSAAGLVRDGETAEEAARRTLQRELGITPELRFHGEEYINLDGVRRWMNVFSARWNGQFVANQDDVKETEWISVSEAERHQDSMPTLRAAIGIYKKA